LIYYLFVSFATGYIHSGEIMINVTLVSTLAQSYLHASSHLADGAAELATSRMEGKYTTLSQSFPASRT